MCARLGIHLLGAGIVGFLEELIALLLEFERHSRRLTEKELIGKGQLGEAVQDINNTATNATKAE